MKIIEIDFQTDFDQIIFEIKKKITENSEIIYSISEAENCDLILTGEYFFLRGIFNEIKKVSKKAIESGITIDTFHEYKFLCINY